MNSLLELFQNLENITDPALKYTLEVMLYKSGATIPEDADWYYSQQTKVVFQGLNIVSVEPLKYLTNLEILVLDNNEIVDITPLYQLSNVYHLNLIGNEIRSVEGIEVMQNIKELYLGDNYIKDIYPLSTMYNLRYLGLRNNRKLADITALERLTAMEKVNLKDTAVSLEDANRLSGILPGCTVMY